jgi:hypothetical protein
LFTLQKLREPVLKIGIERIIFRMFCGFDKIRTPCGRELFVLIISQAEAYARKAPCHLKNSVQILDRPAITVSLPISVPTLQRGEVSGKMTGCP